MPGGFKNLLVYKKAFALAMEIFEITKTYPADEIFSLTSQLRKASRSVCSNIGEGYRKRQYSAHFVSKMSDADMENSEVQVWLDFSLTCKYISQEQHQDLNLNLKKLVNYYFT